jgi:hypothetical protein
MKNFLFLAFWMISLSAFSQSLTLPIDFESTSQTYTFGDFDGGQSSVISNPQSSGINTSANVGQMIKGTGQPWGGSFLELGSPIDFTNERSFKVKVYSPRVGARLLLKVENESDGAIYYEVEDTVSVANSWEQLSFDMSFINRNQSYSKIIFIFDVGVAGDGSSNFTFLFDDIELVNEGPYLDQIDLPVTFDDPTVDYTLTDFGGNYSEVTTDPAGGSNQVAKATKSLGAATWAGTTVSRPIGLATPIPLNTTDSKMNVRIFAPRSGITIRLKVEDASDPTRSVETEAVTTQGNAWETLEFDFNNEAMGTAALNPSYTFNMASIFFFFGTDGAGAGADTVYYFDDLKFGPAMAGTGINDLEAKGFSFGPNPVQELLSLRANEPIEALSIINLQGKTVFQSKEKGTSLSLDLSALPAAMYIMQLRIGEHRGSYPLLKSE